MKWLLALLLRRFKSTKVTTTRSSFYNTAKYGDGDYGGKS